MSPGSGSVEPAAVSVTELPSGTVYGPSAFAVGGRFWITAVVAEALSLTFTGSTSSPVTLAVFVIDVPAAPVGVTVIVRVALLPTASVPTEQDTTPTAYVQPGAETKLTPAGSGSLIVTPLAGSGPLLVTVTV